MGDAAHREPEEESGRHSPLPGTFWIIWSAGGISMVGTGVVIGALPLLAASLTGDARLVSLTDAASQCGWLLLGLIAGVYADRWNRTGTMWRIDAVRTAIALFFAVMILEGRGSIALMLGVGFTLGLLAPFFDSASAAAIPQVVEKGQLDRANSLGQTSSLLATNLLGPPVGALLFTLLPALPFAVQAGALGIGSALVHRVRRAAPAPTSPRRRDLLGELREGLALVLRDSPLLRVLAVLLTLVNGATAAAVGVLVLYVLHVLHLPRAIYGLTDTVVALGGIAGAVLASRVIAAVGTRRVIVGSLLLYGAAIGGLGAWPAIGFVAVCLVLLGVAAAVSNIVIVSTVQRETPPALLGRVSSVFRFCGFAAMPTGAALGGVLAQAGGLRAPYLLAGALVIAVTLVSMPVIWTARAAPA